MQSVVIMELITVIMIENGRGREDGTGSCAFVYPKRIYGEKAHFADAFANDQDWALAFYLMVNE